MGYFKLTIVGFTAADFTLARKTKVSTNSLDKVREYVSYAITSLIVFLQICNLTVTKTVLNEHETKTLYEMANASTRKIIQQVRTLQLYSTRKCTAG